MNNQFSSTDRQFIRTKIDKGLFTLARTYVPFFVALFLAYLYAKPKSLRSHMTEKDFDHVYWILFVFLGGIFFFFLFKDYKKNVFPFQKEIRSGTKKMIPFKARKYFDPVYGRYLLFHPAIENRYILVSENLFNSIEENEQLQLETGAVTGVTLALEVKGQLYTDADDFTF